MKPNFISQSRKWIAVRKRRNTLQTRCHLSEILFVLPADVPRNMLKQSPKGVEDLYKIPIKLLSNDCQLKADHPGFNDQIYRARRQQIADFARTYKQ